MIYLDKQKTESKFIVTVSALDLNSKGVYFLHIYSYNENEVLKLKLKTNISEYRFRYDEFVLPLSAYEKLYVNDYLYEIKNEDGIVFDRGPLRVLGIVSDKENIPKNFLSIDENIPNDIRFIEDI